MHIKSESKKWYYLIFLLRRTALLLLAFMLQHQAILFVSLSMMNLFCSLYLGGSNVWAEKSLRNFDVINEWFFCTLTYFSIMASDMVPSAAMTYKLGWFYAGFIMFFITCNLVPVITGFGHNMSLYCKYYYIRIGSNCCGLKQKKEDKEDEDDEDDHSVVVKLVDQIEMDTSEEIDREIVLNMDKEEVKERVNLM